MESVSNIAEAYIRDIFDHLEKAERDKWRWFHAYARQVKTVQATVQAGVQLIARRYRRQEPVVMVQRRSWKRRRYLTQLRAA